MSTYNTLDYIYFAEGMVVVESCHDDLGRGIVVKGLDYEESDGTECYYSIIWENGEVYEQLPSETQWVIFEEVGYASPEEVFLAKLCKRAKFNNAV